MELQRIILIAALGIVSLLLWNQWQHDYPTKGAPTTQQAQKTQPTGIPVAATHSEPTPTTVIGETDTAPVVPKKVAAKKFIHVRTDTLNVKINTLGGTIIGAALPKFPEKLNTPDKPVVLLSDDPARYYVVDSALMGDNGPDTAKTRAQFTTPQKSYVLKPDQNTLNVALNWQSKQGVKVSKIFTFKRGDYLVKVHYKIDNQSTQPWQSKLYTQITRKKVKNKGGSLFQVHPYMGAAMSSPEKHYKEISFKSMQEENLDQTVQGGWIAMVQHYFLSAWVPPANQPYQYYSRALGNETYTIGMSSPSITVKPGAKATVGARLYLGPENTDRLAQIAPNLNLTVSYGWFWFISVPIFWVLKHIYDVVGNWGWAIILVTILIKLLFYYPSAKSYRSMAKMRKLQPKVQEMRERFKDDKQKFSQAMMELYRKEKANPLGGCLPILIQIPVFIALYMVLLESVELRQAPWILWIKDLSLPDPYYILPVMMGVTMFIQQKLSPPPPDPTQAKVMLFLPLLFTYIFIHFPAGLVLYWTVNNALSILQQWYITRQVEHGST